MANKSHRSTSAIHERILSAVDMERKEGADLPLMTGIEVLSKIGINHPSNAQCKECAAALRELFGDSKRINGQNKWRVPLKFRYVARSVRSERDL